MGSYGLIAITSPRESPCQVSLPVAIGGIAFEDPGKNPVTNPSAAPADFISVGTCEIFPAEQVFLVYLSPTPHEFCPRIFHRKNVPTPPENLIFGKIG